MIITVILFYNGTLNHRELYTYTQISEIMGNY